MERRFVTRLLCAVLATLLFWMPASQVVYAQDPEGEHAGGGDPSTRSSATMSLRTSR
ncbi:MAG: hypothetical protein M5U28_07730 [Sandaracinaceae bacterium]|nr:hypothetical protein [Sandaracinaceae bacterium]